MTQESIRNDLKQYLKDNGIKNKFIAKQIGLSESMVSYFLIGKKGLSSNRLDLISKIIYK